MMAVWDNELFDSLSFVSGAGKGQAHNRNLIGETAADIACRVLNAQRLRIDGRRNICPDFIMPDGAEGEIKSCRRKHKRATIYKFRLEKEAAYCPSLRYLYVFLSHNASALAEQRGEVVEAFQKGIELYCCTLLEVQVGIAASGCSLRSVKLPEDFDPVTMKRTGYYRDGYRDGFYLFDFTKMPWSQAEICQVPICGAMTPCSVYISPAWKQTRTQ
jgi:hypothetical protein